MADLFEEVEEQLRSDRYRAFLRKALPWVLGVASAGLIGVAGYWLWQSHEEQLVSQASEQYAAGVGALEQGRRDDAVRLLTNVSESPAKGYKSLALMQLGDIQLQENHVSTALDLFGQSAQAAPDEVIGDAARLKSAYALLDTAPEKDVEARLTPLLQDGRPYRLQAREALGFAKLMAGDLPGARGEFVIISGMLDAPQGARARAKAAIGLIDSGSAKALASTVHAAAALPPPPPAPAEPAGAGAPSTATAPAQPAQTQAPGPQ